jgi:hypothetical protein
VPWRRIRGIRVLLSAPAGAFVAILLVLASPPADAGAVRAKAAVEPTSLSVESTVSSLLKQAEEIEVELAQTPGDEGLLENLTRTRVNAANAMIADGAVDSMSGVEEMKRQLALAGVAWSKYLKVAKKPSPGLAILVAPAFFRLAELASNSQEALKNVKVAASAQKLGAEGQPGNGSWSTLAFYDLFAQYYNAADESIEKATSYTNTKFERESIEKRFEQVEKDAKQFGRRLKHQ